MRTISHPNLFSFPVVSDRQKVDGKSRRRARSLSSWFWSFSLPSESSVYAMTKEAYEREAKRSITLNAKSAEFVTIQPAQTESESSE